MLMLGAQFSCVNDSQDIGPDTNDDDGDDTEVSVDPGIVRDFSEAVTDSSYIVFRILAFDHNKNMKCTHNFYYGYANDSIFRFYIKKGTYDFVFIANEVSDENASRKLQLIGNRNADRIDELKNIFFDHTAFDSKKHIPMVAVKKEIEVLGDTLYMDNGTQYEGVMPIAMTRLAVRVDVTLTTEVELVKRDFQEISFTNIPSRVPLLATEADWTTPIHNANFASDRTGSPYIYVKAKGDKPDWEQYTEAGVKKYRWSKDRIIIPSSTFSDPTQAANAITFRAKLKNNREVKAPLGWYTPNTSAIDPDPIETTQPDYTLPRNTRITFKGELTDYIRFDITIRGWGTRVDVPVENDY
ncbi:hypothetical protein D0T85_02055 [Bacteroides sp. 519]|nr:hypothetical protein [Bacteroides sp. 519]